MTTPVSGERVAVIVQARMGSTRLPGKTLMDLGGTPVLGWVVTRLAMSEFTDEVIVATSDLAEDDAIAEYISGVDGVDLARGDALDVLDRFVTATRQTEAGYLGRITADCPFVQPAMFDIAIAAADGHDYVCTGHEDRFPRGFDLEVIRRDALLRAHRETTDAEEREHVTPYIARRPELFDHAPLPAPEWARRPEYRLTVDEPADVEMLRAVVAGLDATPTTLTATDLFEFLDAHPEIAAINSDVHHRTVR